VPHHIPFLYGIPNEPFLPVCGAYFMNFQDGRMTRATTGGPTMENELK
jgi:hypothetical protein